MSAAAAAAPADAGGAKPAKKGKKKLIIIIVAVLVLLLAAGGAAMFVLKKKPVASEDGDEAAAPAAEHKSEKIDPKHPPAFVALEPFVVNLSDKGADRFAQIGITLEVENEHFGEEMKAFMPAIRNGILMILSHKSSVDLLDRAGKEKLAGQIQREAGRTMGVDIEEPDPEEAAGDDEASTDKAGKGDDDEAPKAKAKAKKQKKKKKKPAAEENPVRRVLFSNFIIQ